MPHAVLTSATAPTRTLPRPRAQIPPTGYRELDALPLLPPGRLAVLDRPPQRLLYRILAHAAHDGGAFVLDGGNRFDAYALADAARRLRLDVDRVLENAALCRAFTPYQMQTLVESTLPRAATGVRLALVLDLHAPYHDPDTPRREGRTLHRRALRSLRRHAQAGAPIVLAALSTGLRRPGPARDETLAGADDVISFLPQGDAGALRVSFARSGLGLLCHAPDSVQRPLTDWTRPRFPHGATAAAAVGAAATGLAAEA